MFHILRTFTSLIFLLLCVSLAVLIYGVMYPSARDLSSSEIEYVKMVFAGDIDYSKVKVAINSPFTQISSITTGNTIHLKISSMQTEASSSTNEITFDKIPLLVHELTHVWQYQHKSWSYFVNSASAQFKAYLETGSRNGAYDWRSRVAEGSDFENWNTEEQAEAVEQFSYYIIRDETQDISDEEIAKLGCIVPVLSAKYCVKERESI